MRIPDFRSTVAMLKDEAIALASLPDVGVGSQSDYEFEEHLNLWSMGAPMRYGCDRIVVHHQGGHMGFADLVDWQKRERNGSYHEYVEDGRVYQLLTPRQHAWHMHEGSADRAAWLGARVRDDEIMAGRRRGDYGAYGMCLLNRRLERDDGDALGRKWIVDDEVVKTAMWRIADLWMHPPEGLDPFAPVFVHFEFDPGGKPTDPVGSVTAGMLTAGAASICLGREGFRAGAPAKGDLDEALARADAELAAARAELSNAPSPVSAARVSALIVAALRAAANELEGA